MTGHKSCVCGSTQAQGSGVSLHCIHKTLIEHIYGLKCSFLVEDVIKPSTEV